MNKSWWCIGGLFIQQVFEHLVCASHHVKNFFTESTPYIIVCEGINKLNILVAATIFL